MVYAILFAKREDISKVKLKVKVFIKLQYIELEL